LFLTLGPPQLNVDFIPTSLYMAIQAVTFLHIPSYHRKDKTLLWCVAYGICESYRVISPLSVSQPHISII